MFTELTLSQLESAIMLKNTQIISFYLFTNFSDDPCKVSTNSGHYFIELLLIIGAYFICSMQLRLKNC